VSSCCVVLRTLLQLARLCVLILGTAGVTYAAAPATTVRSAIAPPTPEEAHKLDAAARDLELRIERSGRLYGRTELDDYLQGIAARLLATEPESPQPVRVRAVKDGSANAFVLPNGAIFITTELLCRVDSEAEVAAILGHELTHYTHQHLLREMRDEKRKTATSHAFGNVLGMLVTIVAARYGTSAADLAAIPQQALDVWTVASVAGYSRDLEREADREGLRQMAAAGYDASASVRVFEKLAAAAPAAASAAPVKYASHPKLEERRQSAQSLIESEFRSAAGDDRHTGRDEYQAHVAGLRLDQVEVLLESNQLDRARPLLAGEVARNDSARAAFLEGEIARLTVPRTAESEAQALAAYARATTLPGTPVSAFRQLGLAHRARGDREASRAAFETYLERAPEAADVPLVKLYLAGLREPEAAAAATKRDP
jgi:beta-barrel assembly-enhancing protease